MIRYLKHIVDENSPYAYLFETMTKLCDVLALKTDLGVELRDSYRAKDQIVELEVQLLPFAYRTQTDVSQLVYNDWRRSASSSNI